MSSVSLDICCVSGKACRVAHLYSTKASASPFTDAQSRCPRGNPLAEINIRVFAIHWSVGQPLNRYLPVAVSHAQPVQV